MNRFVCPKCRSTYKNEGWLKKHIPECGIKTTKKKRSSIPGKLRKVVWETYIGQKTESKCFIGTKQALLYG